MYSKVTQSLPLAVLTIETTDPKKTEIFPPGISGQGGASQGGEVCHPKRAFTHFYKLVRPSCRESWSPDIGGPMVRKTTS